MSRIGFVIVFIAVVLLTLAWGCSKSGTESRQPQLMYPPSACRPGSETSTAAALGKSPYLYNFDTIYFETRCDTLIVYHGAKWANCGSKFIFDFQQEGPLLVFTEIDTSSQMLRCMCVFDLMAQVSDLANGTYTVQLWDGGNVHGWGGPADSLILQEEVEISCP